MDTMIIVIIVGCLAAVGIGIWIWVRLEKNRTADWEAVATRLGAKFIPKGSEAHAGFEFRLFSKGSRRRMKNHLKWESERVTIHLADYFYTTYQNTGQGRSSKVHRQTVCILEKEGSSFPKSFLRRERGLIDWVGEKFGTQDIDFEDDPDFSKAFMLKGDEIQTKNVFSRELRQHFLENRKSFRTFEMSGNAILLDFGSRRKPEDYADLVAVAMPVIYLSSSSSGW